MDGPPLAETNVMRAGNAKLFLKTSYQAKLNFVPKYGVHAFLLEGSRNNEVAARVIAQVAELGFDFVEIPLLRPNEFDSAFLKENAAKAGLA